MHEEQPEDDLVVLVQTFQWENWTDLRFSSPDSEPYRRAVARLASRLVAANLEAERAETAEGMAELEKSLRLMARNLLGSWTAWRRQKRPSLSGATR
jgi:hypothetical protein